MRAEIRRLREEEIQLEKSIGMSLQGRSERPARSVEERPPVTDTVARLNTDEDRAAQEKAIASAQQKEPQDHGAAEARLLDEVLSKENPDPTWAPSATKTIQGALSRPELSTLKYTTYCGRTLCRLDFDLQNVPNGINALTAKMPWDGQAFFHVDGEGKGKGRFYFARDGHELLKLDSLEN